MRGVYKGSFAFVSIPSLPTNSTRSYFSLGTAIKKVDHTGLILRSERTSKDHRVIST